MQYNFIPICIPLCYFLNLRKGLTSSIYLGLSSLSPGLSLSSFIANATIKSGAAFHAL